MTPRPNAEESLVTLRQPPITSSRQVSRDSDLSAEDSTPASVVSPRENNDVVRHEAGTTPFIPLPVATSTSTATPHYTISPPKISMQSIDDRSPLAGTKRKMGSPSSQCSTPMTRRDSLPMDVRNQKMKATDCLLFAASLLEQETAETLVAASSSTPFVPTISAPPSKKTKPLKKMVCEKLERSMQEAAKQKKELGKKEQLEQDSSSDQDCENKPNDADVLCGRGGKVNKHPGNIVYRKVVEYNKSYYQSVHKKHRILVSQSIVRAILNYGGRFMGQKGKEWTPICFKRAVQKTSQALRERSNSSDVLAPDFAAAPSRKQPIVVEAVAK